MRITVIGLGYVGAVTSVCLAKDGHHVYGVDLDPHKVALLESGRTPIIEDQIQEITEAAAGSGNLHVATALSQEAIDVDLVFVCVGTPSARNGAQDLTAVERVCAEIGGYLANSGEHPAIIIRSTIPAGTTDQNLRPILEQASGKTAGTDFGLGFQPEFLREGSSVKDFYNPPFTVVGGDGIAIARCEELFADFPNEFVATDLGAAEMLKVACNAFHAAKITFANEVGRVARVAGLDARNVMSLLCEDKQLNISPAYLRPGFSFGGSCLPKDLRGLLYYARQKDVELPMLEGVLTSNSLHTAHAADLVFGQSSREVGFLGLSFKQGTDDLRESPLVTLAETLIGKGYNLRIYDNAVKVALLQGSNKRYIEEMIPHFATLLTDDAKEVLSHARVLIIGHYNPTIEQALKEHGQHLECVVDLVGIDPGILASNTQYAGVCW